MSEFKLFFDGNVMTLDGADQKLMEFPKDERLDELYFDILGVSRFKNLISVVAVVSTLSHGQASAERGFIQRHNYFKKNY